MPPIIVSKPSQGSTKVATEKGKKLPESSVRRSSVTSSTTTKVSSITSNKSLSATKLASSAVAISDSTTSNTSQKSTTVASKTSASLKRTSTNCGAKVTLVSTNKPTVATKSNSDKEAKTDVSSNSTAVKASPSSTVLKPRKLSVTETVKSVATTAQKDALKPIKHPISSTGKPVVAVNIKESLKKIVSTKSTITRTSTVSKAKELTYKTSLENLNASLQTITAKSAGIKGISKTTGTKPEKPAEIKSTKTATSTTTTITVKNVSTKTAIKSTEKSAKSAAVKPPERKSSITKSILSIKPSAAKLMSPTISTTSQSSTKSVTSASSTPVKSVLKSSTEKSTTVKPVSKLITSTTSLGSKPANTLGTSKPKPSAALKTASPSTATSKVTVPKTNLKKSSTVTSLAKNVVNNTTRPVSKSKSANNVPEKSVVRSATTKSLAKSTSSLDKDIIRILPKRNAGPQTFQEAFTKDIDLNYSDDQLEEYYKPDNYTDFTLNTSFSEDIQCSTISSSDAAVVSPLENCTYAKYGSEESIDDEQNTPENDTVVSIFDVEYTDENSEYKEHVRRDSEADESLAVTNTELGQTHLDDLEAGLLGDETTETPNGTAAYQHCEDEIGVMDESNLHSLPLEEIVNLEDITLDEETANVIKPDHQGLPNEEIEVEDSNDDNEDVSQDSQEEAEEYYREDEEGISGQSDDPENSTTPYFNEQIGKNNIVILDPSIDENVEETREIQNREHGGTFYQCNPEEEGVGYQNEIGHCDDQNEAMEIETETPTELEFNIADRGNTNNIILVDNTEQLQNFVQDDNANHLLIDFSEEGHADAENNLNTEYGCQNEYFENVEQQFESILNGNMAAQECGSYFEGCVNTGDVVITVEEDFNHNQNVYAFEENNSFSLGYEACNNNNYYSEESMELAQMESARIDGNNNYEECLYASNTACELLNSQFEIGVFKLEDSEYDPSNDCDNDEYAKRTGSSEHDSDGGNQIFESIKNEAIDYSQNPNLIVCNPANDENNTDVKLFEYEEQTNFVTSDEVKEDCYYNNDDNSCLREDYVEQSGLTEGQDFSYSEKYELDFNKIPRNERGTVVERDSDETSSGFVFLEARDYENLCNQAENQRNAEIIDYALCPENQLAAGKAIYCENLESELYSSMENSSGSQQKMEVLSAIPEEDLEEERILPSGGVDTGVPDEEDDFVLVSHDDVEDYSSHATKDSNCQEGLTYFGKVGNVCGRLAEALPTYADVLKKQSSNSATKLEETTCAVSVLTPIPLPKPSLMFKKESRSSVSSDTSTLTEDSLSEHYSFHYEELATEFPNNDGNSGHFLEDSSEFKVMRKKKRKKDFLSKSDSSPKASDLETESDREQPCVEEEDFAQEIFPGADVTNRKKLRRRRKKHASKKDSNVVTLEDIHEERDNLYTVPVWKSIWLQENA